MTPGDAERKAGSIGKPMMFTEARISGADELWLRGPHVCQGFWNQPEATAAGIDADGWLHTGDLAHCDSEGFFYIDGRIKDMFISGGVNVYPAEIEALLVQHPAVEEAAVIGVADPQWGEVGVACIVGRATPEELANFLEGRLARYKLPRRYVFVQAMPRTPYGKIVKPELRKWIQEGTT